MVNSTFSEAGHKVFLNKLKQASQPYRDIERFLGEDKISQYIVGPGLLPVVTALPKDIMGKKLLVTRRVAARVVAIKAWSAISTVLGFGS